MAKIAVEIEANLERRATHTRLAAPLRRLIARGTGWNVSNVVCTSGPRDRAFEEQHTDVSIAIVTAGTFQYRSTPGRELMTPGSLLLGNPGQYFECGHEHGVGDRCLSFQYTPEYFEELAPQACYADGSSSMTQPVADVSRAPASKPWQAITRSCAHRAKNRKPQAETNRQTAISTSRMRILSMCRPRAVEQKQGWPQRLQRLLDWQSRGIGHAARKTAQNGSGRGIRESTYSRCSANSRTVVRSRL